MVSGLIGLVGPVPKALAASETMVSVGNVTIVEGFERAASRPAALPITLSRSVDHDVVVNWRFVEGEGSAGADEILTKKGQVVIEAGTTSTKILVTISGDAITEGPETAVVLISTADAVVGRSRGLIVIRDLNANGGISISDVVVPEPGDSGFGSVVLTVQLPVAAANSIEVRWRTKTTTQAATSIRPASAGADFIESAGTTTIAKGTRSARIALTIRGDNLGESKEAFAVVLDAAHLRTQLPAWAVTDTSASVTIVEHPKIVEIAGLDTTGVNDMTSQLQQAFDAAGYNTVLRLPANAQLRVNETLRLIDKNQFVLDGNQATIFTDRPGAIDRTHLIVERGSSITIRNLIIRGAHPSGGAIEGAYDADREFQHGISLQGVRGAEIVDNKITDVYGDFVYLGYEPDNPANQRRWSSDVWIHNNAFTRNGRQGIAITAARDVVIERNFLFDVHRATIDFEPNTDKGGANNVHIVGNFIGEGRLLFVAARGSGERVDNIVVARNYLTGRTLNMSVGPPVGGRRWGWFVIGNISDTTANQTAIRVERTSGVVIEGNLQNFSVPEPAVTVEDGCGRVKNNSFGNKATPSAVPACSFTATPPPPPEPPYF